MIRLCSSLISCISFPQENGPELKALFLDAVALSMAGFSQKHPGESLDDAALAAAYEAWTLSESTATVAACDVIAYMTGRLNTAKAPVKAPPRG